MKKILAIISIFLAVTSFPMLVISVEDNQSLDYDDYIHFSSTGSIGTDDFIYVYFSKDIPDAYLDVFIVNAGNFSNFENHFAYIRYELALMTDPSGQVNFLPPYEDVWYVVFHNVDMPLQRTISVTYKIEFDERYPVQNDGNSGDDAGDSIAFSTLLEPEDYNSSGMLIFTDYIDYYKFYASVNDTLTLTITGLYDSNCDFELYEPGGFVVSFSQVNVTSDILINRLINQTGYWVLKFSKPFTIFTEREVYTIEIEIDTPSSETSTPTSSADIHYKSMITVFAIFSVIIVIHRKKFNVK
ncbi:MAG: hypothetical protein FK733_10880 [Asgard group archaeon]|nr:hypothetical protein [Asgard group archaeon]